MKPGPPKKPTRFRVITGNAGHRPINEAEPKATLGIPEPPPWLTPYAREEWDHITPLLARYKIVTDLDTAALAAYCEAYGDFRSAREHFGRQPALLVEMTTRKGEKYRMPNPFMSISNKAVKIMHGMLAEFGLTPAARSSIIAGDRGKGMMSDDEDPFRLFR